MTKKLIAQIARSAPHKPGVYIFKDRKHRVLYVGKAVDIADRLASYAQATNPITLKMLRSAATVEWIETQSETEALLTEASLIRFQKPKFNVRLRGTQAYPYIKITVRETWPRIFVTRKMVKDGQLYFGPYPDVGSARRAVLAIRDVFPLRPCNYKLEPGHRVKLCIYYHMGRCPGPCEGLITQGEYAQMVKGAVDVLSGRTLQLEQELEDRMRVAADNQEYELAASIRDKLLALRRTTITPGQDREQDLDMVAAAMAGKMASVVVLPLRAGLPRAQERFLLEYPEGTSEAELLSGFLKDYYTSRPVEVGNIVVQKLPDDAAVIAEALSNRAGFRVRLRRVNPSKQRFWQSAVAAAQQHLDEAMERSARRGHPGILELIKVLELERLQRAECFDISHTAGHQTVASCVVFAGPRPERSAYRRYRIRSTNKGDDPKAIHEVVYRRMKRTVDENRPLPDLLIIDGGAPQLSAAIKALEELQLFEKVKVIGLAKRFEEIYLPTGEIISLPGKSPGLTVLKRIRDEAHRFAVEYHRSLRTKAGLVSVLDGVKGLGPQRKRALLRFFGSVDAIRAASIEDLTRVPGIGPATAAAVQKALRG